MHLFNTAPPLAHPAPVRRCLLALIALLTCARALLASPLPPIPKEVRSSHFIVSVNGRPSPVLHAASNYYLLNFDISGPAVVSVTAGDPHLWDRGVVVQPMRYGIRPTRKGATLTFRIPGPIKLSLSRPGEHFADAEMLFLFGNPPAPANITAATPGIRYFAPGVHHENIDAHDGDQIYLAPGAVIFGALNIWQVRHVRVFGTGAIIYDGPQFPYNDEGWQHKPNWHCIVMDNATDIEIDGITCITRSRTWQVQMKDSRHIGFFNVKIIGGNPNDANQDGLDWLGGGDTTVGNSFFRASDDVFALQGNWEGYDLPLLTLPGNDVTNITIEDTVASTSISNTVRVAWPQKTFNSAHFHMSDIDVIHTGFGGCKVPFAFFELWADPDGKGSHTDYSFRNIRLEDWYSLFQIRQPSPQVRDIRFRGVWAMDGPAMLPPVLKGDVRGVSLDDTSLTGSARDNPILEAAAAAPLVTDASLEASFTYSTGILRAGSPVTFTAAAPADPALRFEWIFGDSSRAFGHTVRHTFPDARGTDLDGSGRFRVALHVTRPGATGQTWSTQHLVLARKGRNNAPANIARGARVYTADLIVPADGGYTVTLLTSTKASLAIDGLRPALSPKPRPQVCGSPGNAVQPLRVSATLTAGPHRLRVTRDDSLENADTPSPELPLLLWEGPNIARPQPPPTIQR